MPEFTIFARGEIANSPDGIYMTDTRKGDTLKWIAKRGEIDDWAIYIHWSENGYEFVESNGDKVISAMNIKKLVPCDDEAFKMYRY